MTTDYSTINAKVWVTRDQGPFLVGDMTRSHIRNTLQWCMRKQDRRGSFPSWMDPLGHEKQWHFTKDGHTYQEWAGIFTVKLLDPDLGEVYPVHKPIVDASEPLTLDVSEPYRHPIDDLDLSNTGNGLG